MSGYVFTMDGGPVTWSSKHQTMVALSIVEAEYVAMSRCAQQMTWMQSWLDEVSIAHTIPGIIRGDNKGVITLMKNMRDHGKIKHIDICYHYISLPLTMPPICLPSLSPMTITTVS